MTFRTSRILQYDVLIMYPVREKCWMSLCVVCHTCSSSARQPLDPGVMADVLLHMTMFWLSGLSPNECEWHWTIILGLCHNCILLIINTPMSLLCQIKEQVDDVFASATECTKITAFCHLVPYRPFWYVRGLKMFTLQWLLVISVTSLPRWTSTENHQCDAEHVSTTVVKQRTTEPWQWLSTIWQ